MKKMKDVIIILGGGVNHSGSLKKITKQRIEAGLDLYRKGVAEAIITSGFLGITELSTFIETESESMKEKLVKLGVPGDKIFAEEKSRDTIENAFFCNLLYLKPNNWRDIVIVTSDFHAARAKYIFKKVLGNKYTIDVIGVKSGYLAERLEKEADILNYDKKCLAMVKCGDESELKRILFYHHPLYQDGK